MVKIYDNETGASLGEITEEQLNFLIDQLEEEHSKDQDYYMDQNTLDLLKEKGMDDALFKFLKNALGSRDSMEIRWEK